MEKRRYLCSRGIDGWNRLRLWAGEGGLMVKKGKVQRLILLCLPVHGNLKKHEEIRPTSPCAHESEDGGYGSLKAESSFATTCNKKSVNLIYRFHNQRHIYTQHLLVLLTSVSLCLLAKSSCVGECGLLTEAPLTGSSRPLGSSWGLLAGLGSSSPLCAVAEELLAGGEAGFALAAGSSESKRGQSESKLESNYLFFSTAIKGTSFYPNKRLWINSYSLDLKSLQWIVIILRTLDANIQQPFAQCGIVTGKINSLEPITGMDMPWSVAVAAAAASAPGAGKASTKSCLGGLTLQNNTKTLAQKLIVDLVIL